MKDYEKILVLKLYNNSLYNLLILTYNQVMKNVISYKQ